MDIERLNYIIRLKPLYDVLTTKRTLYLEPQIAKYLIWRLHLVEKRRGLMTAFHASDYLFTYFRDYYIVIAIGEGFFCLKKVCQEIQELLYPVHLQLLQLIKSISFFKQRLK